ncbi:uncharacterized protein BXZ73DRAFT_87259 [Epithele typhae]|uniref:uncharacterized protein n=1 Tax=Epithele typhae TaxID=378194 RepID=UPI0020082557|nr:uncharacterized protein BXZ73DRAFT_87259 [Epithele typhae]KAH9944339.1 hypothetical protein BXZ73DRAFT_87259 [Epithele typhae]
MSEYQLDNKPPPVEAPPTFEDSQAASSSSTDAAHLGPPPDAAAAPKYVEHPLEYTYIPPGGEEPPPEFTPYEAEYFISGKEIVTHDPHLNEDGEALYRFLLSQSTTRPDYRVHLRGTHTEHRTRSVTRTDSNGHTRHETETYTETVTDFDFYIDLTPQIVHGPVHWSLPDAEPAYRGQMFMQVDALYDPTNAEPAGGDPEGQPMHLGRRKATKQEKSAAKDRKAMRKECGLPPWVAPAPESWFEQTGSGAPPAAARVLESSKTLRQWADEYCASDKVLKEFTYTKVVYGWNTANLTQALQAAIRSVYRHNIHVSFDLALHKIRVRADNTLARTLSNRCLKFLLCVTLVYPFLWLWRRFSARGGGRWEPPGASPPFAPGGGARWQQAPTGEAMALVGESEGEWFQRWEGAIRDAVWRRRRSGEALQPFVPQPYFYPAPHRPLALGMC